MPRQSAESAKNAYSVLAVGSDEESRGERIEEREGHDETVREHLPEGRHQNVLQIRGQRDHEAYERNAQAYDRI